MRAPRLVVGLGNPLMGDDGVGLRVLERLRADPRLPADVEIRFAGTDLLALADELGGRRRVVLVDALLGDPPGRPGRITRLDPRGEELERGTGSAHAPSLSAAVRLLGLIDPALAELDLSLVAVEVADANVGAELSPAVARALPAVVDEVLQILG